MGWTIEAVDDDAAAVQGVIEVIRVVFEEYGFVWDPAEELWDLLRAGGDGYPYRLPQGRLWVMRSDEDGDVVGSVAAEVVEGGTAELHRLYLDAGLRGKGLGRALLETAMAWSRDQGCARAVLWSDTRFTDSHRLYARLGYARGAMRAVADANETREWRFEREL